MRSFEEEDEPEVVCCNFCSLRSWALRIAFFQLVYSIFRLGGWVAVSWLNLDQGYKNDMDVTWVLMQFLLSLLYLLIQFLYLHLTFAIFKGIYRDADAKTYVKKLEWFQIIKGLEVCLVIFNLEYMGIIFIPIFVIMSLDLGIALLYGRLVLLHSRRQPQVIEFDCEDVTKVLVKEPLPEPVNV